MKNLAMVFVLVSMVSTGYAFAQQPAAPPLSAEAQRALTMRDFQALAGDYGAEASARQTAETELSAARATIAAQQLKLSWWAKYAAGLKKVK